ncbi:tyrosine-type recombinase/integrase [Microbacterium aoyamense]|uniref:tyrosine-type recombinase/integrase n=1 Tax=Microbacterium aoyamense TaxID=344166 RepID=UPI002004FDB8|nr:tyrosine-type recombinase/integrase [Microbacterium aoyamense]
MSEQMRRRRLRHVRRFALFAKVSPWHVSRDLVDAWCASLAPLAPSTRTAMTGDVRCFYRWAMASQRVTADPTAHTGHKMLRRPVPEQWDAPILAFERSLWAQGTSPSTVRAWGDGLRAFARDHAHLQPFAVTVDDLYEWMAGKRWARETRRGRKSMLRTFYAWAVETERTTENPTLKLPKVKAGDPVARPATDAEYATALGDADPRWGLALRLAAELGLRRAEVARVHTSDLVDDGNGATWLTVHGKGSKLRRVPMPWSLAAAVRAHGPGYVFPGRIVERQAHVSAEGHLSPRYVGKRLAELLPAGVTMHALRHRFATKAYNVDRDVFTVQKLLGHASPATTQRYVQVADDRMRALVEAVNGR